MYPGKFDESFLALTKTVSARQLWFTNSPEIKLKFKIQWVASHGDQTALCSFRHCIIFMSWFLVLKLDVRSEKKSRQFNSQVCFWERIEFGRGLSRTKVCDFISSLSLKKKKKKGGDLIRFRKAHGDLFFRLFSFTNAFMRKFMFSRIEILDKISPEEIT